MTVLGIDPGSELSAWVLWDGSSVRAHDKAHNYRLLHGFAETVVEHVVIEEIASYGMPVGAEVFATVFWAGRLAEAAARRPEPMASRFAMMPRRDVKLHLCGSMRAKDANVRQALIDRFGGKEKAIGKKANKGPLYGIKADEWQALALAVTFHDQHTESRC